MTWNWVQPATVYAVHDKQLSAHGGSSGVRNLNAVESVLSRAQNLAAYGKLPHDAADLAAAYIHDLATNHGFSDGNKRTAWVIGRLFLAINNIKLQFTHVDAINFMRAVASGSKDEVETSDWIRQRIVPETMSLPRSQE
ncbi:type II toxin-antitoxin system death-on-curing family toxin [Pseudoduganella ginsengisoli]|uniref:Type II toxin-antitoxin system death-on-curing family toxin n=1 Tax=Pseudoduganella ginsengisoli TaxID=1462440 RepID=A0A6L6PU42_9BURK|nr:type II toxin-antitoxin system death-on-curing family toxin [Pseudoduganella ginsengisoli]MTW00759.1 type II toxin-antitoxin system death-on-curing family toxin [Pseudoduganella ginsengisoli]